MINHNLFIKRMIALAAAFLFLVSPSVTHVKATPTTELTSEQMEAVIEEVFAALVAFDVAVKTLSDVTRSKQNPVNSYSYFRPHQGRIFFID